MANLLVKLFALSLRKDSTGSPFPGMKSKIKNPQLVRRRFFILCSASSPAVAGEPATLRLIRQLPDSTIEQNLSYVLPAFMRL